MLYNCDISPILRFWTTTKKEERNEKKKNSKVGLHGPGNMKIVVFVLLLDVACLMFLLEMPTTLLTKGRPLLQAKTAQKPVSQVNDKTDEESFGMEDHSDLLVAETGKYDKYLNKSEKRDVRKLVTQYALPPPKHICKCDPDMLILVLSRPQNIQLRQIIRETWGSVHKTSVWPILNMKLNVTIKVGFLIGQARDKHLQWQIEEEYYTHYDTIVGMYEDDYNKLAYKVSSGLHFAATYCSSSKFVMKIDDDVLPDLPLVVMETKNVHKKTILGHFQKAAVHREGKWAVRIDDYPYLYYPTYANGPMYAFTIDVARFLARQTLRYKVFFIEDVWITGILVSNITGLKRKSVNPIYDYGDNFTYYDNLCHSNADRSAALFYHTMSPENIRKVWVTLQRGCTHLGYRVLY